MGDSGSRTSQRQARLYRVFHALLALAACLAAIVAVRADYERAERGSGLDFYVFWLGGEAVHDHEASGAKDVLELYTQSAHERVGEHYYQLARSRRQRAAATDRRVVETVSSPFYCWVFSLFAPADYDREYLAYVRLCIACMVATTIGLAWRLGYSISGIGVALTWVAISAPVYSEFTVVNFNFPEVAVCCIYFMLRSYARRWPRFSLVWWCGAGVVMGLLNAAKPNLLLLPVFLGVRALLAGRWRNVLAEGVGFVLAVMFAVAVSSRAFGGASCWIAWGRFILELSGRPTMPSFFGNFSVATDLFETTGHNLIPLFSVVGILLAVAAVWMGRKPLTPSPLPAVSAVEPYSGERARVRGDFDELRKSPKQPLTLTLSPEYRGEGTRGDPELLHDLAIFGIAVAVTLLTSGLAWLHYPILLFPFLLLAGSRLQTTFASNIARYALLTIVLVLLTIPPAAIESLLPFRMDVEIRTWIHCTQAAVILTLGMALWFEARVLRTIT